MLSVGNLLCGLLPATGSCLVNLIPPLPFPLSPSVCGDAFITLHKDQADTHKAKAQPGYSFRWRSRQAFFSGQTQGCMQRAVVSVCPECGCPEGGVNMNEFVFACCW